MVVAGAGAGLGVGCGDGFETAGDGDAIWTCDFVVAAGAVAPVAPLPPPPHPAMTAAMSGTAAAPGMSWVDRLRIMVLL